MIQRIQSVYLFIVFVISVVLLFIPMVSFEFNNNLTTNDVNNTQEFASGNHLCMLVDVLIGIIAFLTVRLFQKRKRQLFLCWILIILLFVLFMLILLINAAIYGYSHLPNFIGAYLPIASILFCLLARRAIRKDEDLIRSADRLR